MTFYDELETKSSEELLKEYHIEKDHRIKQEIVLRYVGIVRRIATQMKDVYSGFAQTDDIVNEGVIALMKAIDKFDPEKNVKFDTYISKRIKGLIIDLARKQDWVPRSVRKTARDINDAINTLYVSTGKMPTDIQVAEFLGITVEKYWERMSKTNFFGMLSLDVIIEESSENRKTVKMPSEAAENSPENILLNNEVESALLKGMEVLRDREELVIMMYYHQNMNMREIAENLGVSEPRVSQIHANAIKKLRTRMQEFTV